MGGSRQANGSRTARPLPGDVVSAWEKAGASVGWLGPSRRNGRWHFNTQLKELDAAQTVPAFKIHIFERLRDEDSDVGRYKGGYDAVRRFVKKHRESKWETFIPLDHAPSTTPAWVAFRLLAYRLECVWFCVFQSF